MGNPPADRNLFKMLFSLTADEDGWPPVGAESVWVIRLSNGLYKIDNIPFFVKLIALGDQVEGLVSENTLLFKRLVKPSGNATIRIIFNDLEQRSLLIDRLVNIGCEYEGCEQFKIVAISIPPGTTFDTAMSAIRHGAQENWWDYEEGCLPAKPRKGLWDLLTGGKRWG